jgi:serine-type D-Ala-D-Ala carboxypeptidase (penicillin-binding protein 5/6)
VRAALIRVSASLSVVVLVVAGTARWSGPAAASAPPATTTTTVAPPPPAKAELLVDVNTGRVLLGQNDHTPLPPGSLSKILTALIAVAWLPPNSIIPVTPAAANVYPFRIGMEPGQKWPFSETLRALLIYSANDAAYALAQRIGGSLQAFGAKMQLAAMQMAMRDHPVLHDPAGLDGTEGVDGGNLISAWDLAIAARAMMANPTLAAIAGTPALQFTSPAGTVYDLSNMNQYFLQWYPGAIGVKTGLTDAAGFCVIEEAQRGGRRMMAVVLDGSSSYQTAADLLNQGFATPVAAEPRSDPVLPPIVEPHKPPPPPIAVRPMERYKPSPAAASKARVTEEGATASNSFQASATAAASGTPAKSSVAPSYGMDIAVTGAITGAAILGGTLAFRRRGKGVGAHSASRQRKS